LHIFSAEATLGDLGMVGLGRVRRPKPRTRLSTLQSRYAIDEVTRGTYDSCTIWKVCMTLGRETASGYFRGADAAAHEF
jgi:hypothetical protein